MSFPSSVNPVTVTGQFHVVTSPVVFSCVCLKWTWFHSWLTGITSVSVVPVVPPHDKTLVVGTVFMTFETAEEPTESHFLFSQWRSLFFGGWHKCTFGNCRLNKSESPTERSNRGSCLKPGPDSLAAVTELLHKKIRVVRKWPASTEPLIINAALYRLFSAISRVALWWQIANSWTSIIII